MKKTRLLITQNCDKNCDGLHYTLHAEATDRDVGDLKELCNLITHSIFYGSSSETSFRLAIDKILYDRYDFSNIDFSGWHVIRKMEWKANCPFPENEELLILGMRYEYHPLV